MSTERVTLASLLASLRRATDKELEAIGHILLLIEKEDSEGEDYRSGVDMGAYSASSLMLLERQIQLCFDIFETLLSPILSADDLRNCRKPLVQMSFSTHFDVMLQNDIRTLKSRREDINRIEKSILSADADEISQMLPESVRERMQAELEEEIGKLGQ